MNKKNNKIKKVLALFLALAMIIPMAVATSAANYSVDFAGQLTEVDKAKDTEAVAEFKVSISNLVGLVGSATEIKFENFDESILKLQRNPVDAVPGEGNSANYSVMAATSETDGKTYYSIMNQGWRDDIKNNCVTYKIYFDIVNMDKLEALGTSGAKVSLAFYKKDVVGAINDDDETVTYFDGNLDVTQTSATIRVKGAQPTGSSVILDYTPQFINASATPNKNVKNDEKVIVTASPIVAGYKVSSVTARDADGDIRVTDNGNGTWEFLMRNSDATVKVTEGVAVKYNINIETDNDGPKGKAQVDKKDLPVPPQASAGQIVTIVPRSGYKLDGPITVTTTEGSVPVRVTGSDTFTMPEGAVNVAIKLKKSSPDDPTPTSNYTLTYKDGDAVVATEKYIPGSNVQLTKTLTKEGFTLLGWNTDAAATERMGAIRMDSNQTVYAIWQEGGTGGGDDPTPIGEGGRNITPDAFNADDHVKYVEGYEDATVRPNSNITRAEVTAMIYRLLKESSRNAIYSTTNSFSDVPARKWYNLHVSSMANGGYVAGYPDGSFGPDKNITRAEFVTMLANFLEAPLAGTNSFSDVKDTHWAYKNIVTAVSAGWVSGYEDGTFRPNNQLTRAEAISILNRVLNRNPQSEEDMYEDMIRFKDNMDSGKWYYLDILEATNGHEYVRNENGFEKWA